MNAPGAPLGVDEPAQLLGVDSRREDVRAAGDERGESGHERGHVEQGPAVQVDVVGPDPLQRTEKRALGHERPVREQGAVRDVR